MALELVIHGGEVYDGLGHLPVHADVGLGDGRVLAIGDLSKAEGVRRLDARGAAVCPGFVDVHTHTDFTLVRPDHARLLEPMLRQGVTTVVGGNCGVALAPLGQGDARNGQMAFYDFFLGAAPDGLPWESFGGMLDTLERQGTLLNVGVLAPHSILRMIAMGDRSEPARGADLAAQEALLADCLEQGAIGLSTGLQYFPGMYSDPDELRALARVVRRFGGVFTAHLRSYLSTTLPRAIDEVLEIGKSAEVPVQLSHLFWIPVSPDRLAPLMHAATRALSRLHRHVPLTRLPIDAGAKPLLERIARHQAGGYPVGVDAMPTAAGFTHLIALFPPWLISGNRDAVLARLADPAVRKRIRADIEQGSLAWPHREGTSWSMNLMKVLGWGAAFVMAVTSARNQHLCGRSFVDIAAERGQHPFDVMCDLLVEENGRVLVYETGTEPDDPFVELALRATLCHPSVSIVTDAILMGYGRPSHLFHDCYPRFLGGYARDRGLLPLREAIRKCTSLPASQLQLKDRGTLTRGAHADVVVFDPATIASRSTVADPGQAPEGIRYVLVNGQVVVSPEGFHPERLAGQVIRG